MQHREEKPARSLNARLQESNLIIKQMMRLAKSNLLRLRQMENSRKMERMKRKFKKSLKKNPKKKYPKKTRTQSKDLLK